MSVALIKSNLPKVRDCVLSVLSLHLQGLAQCWMEHNDDVKSAGKSYQGNGMEVKDHIAFSKNSSAIVGHHSGIHCFDGTGQLQNDPSSSLFL